MTTRERSGFLHRWSRRKIEAREGTAELPVEQHADVERPAADAESDPSAAEPLLVSTDQGGRDSVPVTDEAEPAPLTLEDVQALTRDSDFSPFVTRNVSPEVKNAALKKLFSDPHYNVMDGLDIYIDDYSNMAPLPAPMLRRMASAHALKMFDTLTESGDERPASPAADNTRAVGDCDAQAPAALDPPASSVPEMPPKADVSSESGQEDAEPLPSSR